MSDAKRKKIKAVKKKAKLYVDALRDEGLPVRSAFLYGSYATGKFGKHSDIDICIVSPKFNPNRDSHRLFLWQKRRDIDLKIEPVGFRPRDFKDTNPLAYEVRKRGIKIV